jgi:dienelactone hydrolase
MRAVRRAPVLLAVLLVLAGAPALRGEKGDRKEPDESKARGRIAEIWVDLGVHLAERGFRAAAEEALGRARQAAPDAPGLAALEAKVAAATDAGAPDAEAEKRRERAAREAAKAWERLAQWYDPSDPRHAEGLLAATALDGAKGRVQRLADAAKKNSVLLRTPRHPMTAWLSLPGGWKSGKTHALLVSCEGAGANFEGNHRGFKGARGSREAIVVTPCALSSTNELRAEKFPHYPADLLSRNAAQGSRVDWDVEGLQAILEAVREHFGGAEKTAITGFSGGGMLCYAFTLRHPERVALCAPACPNFSSGLAGSGPPVEDGGAKVRILTGANDPYRDRVGQEPGIEAQTDEAVAAFERLGYRDVRRTMLPGVGHSSCVAEVWKAFDEATRKAK